MTNPTGNALVKAHKHTCANVQPSSTHEDVCDCGAVVDGHAIEATKPSTAELIAEWKFLRDEYMVGIWDERQLKRCNGTIAALERLHEMTLAVQGGQPLGDRGRLVIFETLINLVGGSQSCDDPGCGNCYL